MRADIYLVENGFARSRSHAGRLIAAGGVRVDGTLLKKAGAELSDSATHRVEICDDVPFVGRGGCKLEAALDAFGVDARDAVALDVGASTGGFTDCLLQRGAGTVFAIDAGVGQLAPALRADARVHVFEKCNARYLTPGTLGDAFTATGGADLIVMDVSFISQTCILPVLPALLRENGRVITLIKPQFEVGRAHVGKGGIVKEPAWRREAVEKVFSAARTVGLFPAGLIRSPITGGDGNVEYLTLLTKNHPDTPAEDLFLPALF